MQKMIKKLRMTAFILFIILAAFAASIGLTILVLPARKEESNEIKIEQPKLQYDNDETLPEMKP